MTLRMLHNQRHLRDLKESPGRPKLSPLALVHDIEGLVDVLQAERVRHELVNLSIGI